MLRNNFEVSFVVLRKNKPNIQKYYGILDVVI